MATDGRRLQVGKCEGICEPGNYRIIKANQSYMFLAQDTEGLIYPSWISVVPVCKSEDIKQILVPSQCSADRGIRKFNIAIKFYGVSNSLFNLDYLNDAVGNLNEFFVYQKDAIEPLLIRNAIDKWTRTVVLMPVRGH